MTAPLKIKVRENEYRGLLNREQVIGHAKSIFPEQLTVLQDVVNYGTHLIRRCFEDSDKELKDIVLLYVLTRQIVAMLDAIEVLTSSGAVYAAGLQARALFEATVSFDWIRKGDAEEKAQYYYVYNLRRERRWAQRTQLGSSEATGFSALAPDLKSLQDPKVVETSKERIAKINGFLSRPEFQPVNKAFDDCLKNRKNDVQWYRPLGIKSVKHMMAEVGKSAEYMVNYSFWSEVMHSSDYSQHVVIRDGAISLRQIRNLSDFGALFKFTVAAALHAYRTVLQLYRPGEMPVLDRKYIENWQQTFMNVPAIKYEEIPLNP